MVDRFGEVRWTAGEHSVTRFAEMYTRLALVSERFDTEQAVLNAAQKRSVVSSLRPQATRQCVSYPTSFVLNALTVREYEMQRTTLVSYIFENWEEKRLR